MVRKKPNLRERRSKCRCGMRREGRKGSPMQVSSLLMYIRPPPHLQSNPPHVFLHEQCGQEHASFSLHSFTSETATESRGHAQYSMQFSSKHCTETKREKHLGNGCRRPRTPAGTCIHSSLNPAHAGSVSQ
jgi:hypothetical protein